MSLAPQTLLDSRQQQAINYHFVEAVAPREAAAAAGIDGQLFDEACGKVACCFRGHGVAYNRFLSAQNPIDADPLRLDYELRLCRLHAQHQRCIENFRRTDDYRRHALKIHLSQQAAEPLSNREISGDIRFLQLARQIRQEMDQLEAKLQEHIEQLAAYYHKTEAAKKAADATAPPTSPPATPSPTPPPNQPKTTSPSPASASQAINTKPVTANSGAARIPGRPETPPPPITREEFLAALAANNIPPVEHPPKKPDKRQAASGG
jgi:hypothetical protein